MPRKDYAFELEDAAERIADISQPDLQIMLRRAALRLRNSEKASMGPEIEKLLEDLVAEMGVTKHEVTRLIVKDWLIANGYLPMQRLDR